MSRETCSRRFKAAEKNVRLSEKIKPKTEVKACNIKPKSKNKLYRILKTEERFGVIINQKKLVKNELFSNKKSKPTVSRLGLQNGGENQAPRNDFTRNY